MTRSEISNKRNEAQRKLDGVAAAIRKSDAYLETQGAADLDQVESVYGSVLQAINASTADDAEMQVLKAWRTNVIAEFAALRSILAERATLLQSKTEVPEA